MSIVCATNRVMEVNNNDPNNNDVILDTSEEQQDLDDIMGMGSSSAMSSSQDIAPNDTSEEVNIYDSDQSEYPPSPPAHTEPDNISDDMDEASEYDSEEEEELDPVDYYGTEESEPEDDSEAQSDEEEAQENVPVASSNSSNQNTFDDDFDLIKKITPRFSDKKILKYLQRNEDHEQRLFAAVWDLMHAVNRPRSKNSKPPSPAFKKTIKTENRVLPVPGKPDVYTLGKTKLHIQNPVLALLPEQNPELANRKDYKRAPKRATVSTEVVDAKKKKGLEVPSGSSSSAQAGPSQAPKDEPMETNTVVAQPRLNVGDTQTVKMVQNAAPLPKPVTLLKTVTVISRERPLIISNNTQPLIRPASFNPNAPQFISPENLQAAVKTITEQMTAKTAVERIAHAAVAQIPKVRTNPTSYKYGTGQEVRTKLEVNHQLAQERRRSVPPVAKPVQAQGEAPLQLERKSLPKMQQPERKGQPQGAPQAAQLIRPAVFNGPAVVPQNRNVPGPSNLNNVASTSGASTSGGSSGASTSKGVEEAPFNFDEGLKILKNKYVFNHLTAMFGQVSRKKILKLCLEHDGLTQNDMLEFLTDHLLAKVNRMDEKRESEAKQPDANNQPTEIQDLQALLQEKCNDLIEIFPDADPEYLRQNAIKHLNDPQGFKEFVQTNLENKDYPTKEEYLKKQKMRRQLEQYITNFNVGQFLEIFPNPFEYFENPKRKTNYTHLSWNYLKNHYNRTKERVIKNAFDKHHRNLSLASKELDNIKGDMKTKRYTQDVLFEHIPFAQEVAFIRHRNEIRAYLNSIKEKERLEFQKYKKMGGLLECQCCFSDECIPSKCATCDNGHNFCYSCIVRGTESKMADGETHVKCFTDCDSEFSLSVLQKVLQPKKFSILLTKRQEAEVRAAGLEGLVACPFCHFASIPPAEDKVFKCLNQDCMKESCRSCKELNHVPLSCSEAKASDKARHFLEERMTEALIRICYSCRKPFFKEEGCNKMTCTCGAKMCYICGQPVVNYNHFRGQGNDNESLCPLYTDDVRLNAETVRREAKKTAENLRARDPNVKLDTEKLMPVLPAPRQGPHNYILGRVDVPVRAQNNFPNNVPNNNADNDLPIIISHREELMNIRERMLAGPPRIVVDRPFDNNRIIPNRLRERIIPDRNFNQEPIIIHDDITDDLHVNPNLTPVNELHWL